MSYTSEADIPSMVSEVMGIATSEPRYDAAVAILQAHYTAAVAASNADNALKSTFSLACQAPTSLGMGI